MQNAPFLNLGDESQIRPDRIQFDDDYIENYLTPIMISQKLISSH